MTAPNTTKVPSKAVVLDASVVVAVCAREPKKVAIAVSQMDSYVAAGWTFYSPGVLVGESLFVLCNKLKSACLSDVDHVSAVAALAALMVAVEPPPDGDRGLVTRAEGLRAARGCAQSADGISLALAERLAVNGPVELLTFDEKQSQRATSIHGVTAKLLTPAP